MKSHKDLNVWKGSVDMVTEIYQITKIFPKEEAFGLTNQIRRSAVSIPSNISEGAARNQTKEFIRFLHISLGSLAELETQLLISKNLGYLKSESYLTINGKLNEIRAQLAGLIRSLKNNNSKK